MADHEDYLPGEAPAAHKTTHQDGGADEVNIEGLTGITSYMAAHILLPTVHQDAPALIATHAAIDDAHHVRYTDAEAETQADAKIAIHTALPTVHQDAPALILTHKGDASAHHARYTDGEARAALSPLSIPSAAFVPKLNTYDWMIDDVFMRNGTALTGQEFFAPVLLPHGATITSLNLYGYRDDALSNLQLYLRRITHVSTHTIMGECLADWTDGFGNKLDSAIGTPIVDNVNYGYVLELHLEPNDNVTDVWFTCAKIAFTG